MLSGDCSLIFEPINFPGGRNEGGNFLAGARRFLIFVVVHFRRLEDFWIGSRNRCNRREIGNDYWFKGSCSVRRPKKRVVFGNFLLKSYNTFLKKSFFLLRIASSIVHRNFFI